jgi:two-component system nitrate/nitrite sensor histidine kinase NarX
MQAALNGAYDQVRAALIGLREPLDDTSGLAEELAAYLAEFEQASGMRAELSTTHPGALALAPVASRQALHIVREALTNARRHAQARRVWVRVERITDGNEACFIVEDDGCGFDVANAGGGNHLGLNIMRARAERCGGRLAIDSTPGAGTKVVVHFPLEPE